MLDNKHLLVGSIFPKSRKNNSIDETRSPIVPPFCRSPSGVLEPLYETPDEDTRWSEFSEMDRKNGQKKKSWFDTLFGCFTSSKNN